MKFPERHVQDDETDVSAFLEKATETNALKQIKISKVSSEELFFLEQPARAVGENKILRGWLDFLRNPENEKESCSSLKAASQFPDQNEVFITPGQRNKPQDA